METILPLPPPVLIQVKGEAGGFPVRRIYCVGRNYADHVREMGGDPQREPPFFFGKPRDAAVPGGGPVAYPPATANLHHEVELVVALGRGGRDIPVDEALDCVYGYAVGLDLTRRDLQASAKEKGQPWDMAKGFDQSAPVGLIHPVAQVGHLAAGAIWLDVNGQERQRGDLSQMTWRVAEILAQLSSFVELAPGDLVFTGTPSGVGRLQKGDRVHCGIDGLGLLDINLT